MLMIRLQRVGRKHEPSFRLVLTDSKNGPKSGRYHEVLGWYDVRRDNKPEQIQTDRVKYWMGHGAQLSDTVHNFLVEHKVIEGKKINKLPRKSPIKKEGQEAAAATASKPADAKASADASSAAVEATPREAAPSGTPHAAVETPAQ
jgi:small subunit ribosomal protein S16